MMLSSKLRLLRVNRALSLQQLSDAVGINISTVSNYETGQRVPGRENLSKLAEFYGVSTDYLLGLQELESEVPEDIAVMFRAADWKNLPLEEQDLIRRVIRAAIERNINKNTK